MVKLDNERGSICISSEVFTWLAGDAATRCFGVKGMAGRAKESGLVQLLRRESMTKGVSVTPNDDGTVYLAKLLADASLAASAGEARRLIDGGGVKINGKAVAPKSYNIDPSALKLGDTLSVGKRKGFKLI